MTSDARTFSVKLFCCIAFLFILRLPLRRHGIVIIKLIRPGHFKIENSGPPQVIPIDAVVELTSMIAEVFDNTPRSVVTFQTITAAVDAIASNPSAG